MNDKDEQEIYWNIVSNIIDVANNELDHCRPGLVASAVITAAARFGAFYAASSSEDKKDLIEDKDDIVKNFGAEFKRKLVEDLEDYIDNYKNYMKTE